MKNLIIFHYHFLPGGVTDVVTSAVISFLTYSSIIDNITIVSGRPANLKNLEDKIKDSVPRSKIDSINFEVLSLIDYMENIHSDVSSIMIKKEILDKYFSPDNIWWIHNYHLGKNPYFTKALIEISLEKKQEIIFQIHDFPECSRYTLLNRLKENIQGDFYPQNQKIRYVVINNRDYNYLINGGINQQYIELLENPIKTINWNPVINQKVLNSLSESFSSIFPAWRKNESYILYPVRAIRRKNIAEAALIATLSEKNIIITLPGVSDSEIQYSERCEKIFTDGLSPGMFGIGLANELNNIPFNDLIGSSSMIISSSVQEGFGYLFLNSMNWGKPLLGKDLDILSNFKKSFEGYPSYFYENISIPLEKIDRDYLIIEYKKKVISLKSELQSSKIDELIKLIPKYFDREYVDFSYLTLELQIKVLKKIKTDMKYRKKCIEKNKQIIKITNNFFKKPVSKNHKILKENWSFESYSLKTNQILQSFNKKSDFSEQTNTKSSISETLQNYFAKMEYLRLLYDE